MVKKLTIVAIVTALFLVCASSAHAWVQIRWVTVGDPGNPNDVHGDGYGAVDYIYRIGKYEVTNSQYCEFLNEVASTDTYELYNTGMANATYGGIERSGSPGTYSYSVKPGRGNWPVNLVSWYDCLRFCNWLHNGQPSGPQDANTTEDGVYDMSLGSAVVRRPDARVWLPSEDEWYKAAYYKAGGSNAGYWDYATQSDTIPTAETPPGGSNSANYDWAVGSPANVGSYDDSYSAYGTFDQSGNMYEWNEALVGSDRCLRGGSWITNAAELPASFSSSGAPGSGGEDPDVGFRVAAAPCRYELLGDMDYDCRVNFFDFAYMAGNWMVDCDRTPDHPACIPVDYDGDGFNWSVDCDDDDPSINPDATETCDSVDNDCDTSIDEDFTNLGDICTVGIGMCEASGNYICTEDGLGTECDAVPGSPTTEICDGEDNDCDGAADEGDPQGGAPCDTGLLGICAAGTEHCQGGALQCVQDTSASPEVCDGLDNDCDGMTDDGDPGGGASCDTGLLGICAAGTEHCQGGALQCVQDTSSSPEVCDGLDNDCDGMTDDGDPGGGASCDTGLPGICAAGTEHCQAGAFVCVQDSSAQPEACDGLDNDCDGAVDDGDPGGGGYCDTGLLGVCAEGTLHCQAGALQCVQDTSSSPEVCDGLDNDCDGPADEGDPGGGAPCNTGLPGICAAGTIHCQAGTLQCVQNDPAEPEMCDGLDNDCDGAIDDGDPAAMCPPGSHVQTTACASATCVIAACDPGYGDLDGNFANGCECSPDGYDSPSQNDTCASSSNLGDEHDDNSGDDKIVNAKISFQGDLDYFRFRAVDDNPSLPLVDNFHVRIQFLSNPAGEFRYSVYKASCGNQVYDGTGQYQDPGTPSQDDTEYYYVRVYRDPGVGNPTCSSYAITMSNGD